MLLLNLQLVENLHCNLSLSHGFAVPAPSSEGAFSSHNKARSRLAAGFVMGITLY